MNTKLTPELFKKNGWAVNPENGLDVQNGELQLEGREIVKGYKNGIPEVEYSYRLKALPEMFGQRWLYKVIDLYYLWNVLFIEPLNFKIR